MWNVAGCRSLRLIPPVGPGPGPVLNRSRSGLEPTHLTPPCRHAAARELLAAQQLASSGAGQRTSSGGQNPVNEVV